jgi:bifunctional non-homologous end joining protein LigD
MKAVPGHFPGWIERATVPKRGGTVTHALAGDAATLVYLAGQNVVTPHLWLSRADQPRRPDRLIIDSTRHRVGASPTCAPPHARPESG